MFPLRVSTLGKSVDHSGISPARSPSETIFSNPYGRTHSPERRAGTGTQGHGCDGHCGGRYTWERGMTLRRRAAGKTKRDSSFKHQDPVIIGFGVLR